MKSSDHLSFQLLLTDTYMLREAEDLFIVPGLPRRAQGIPQARDILPPDTDPEGSENLIASIDRTCAEMSVSLDKHTKRIALDSNQYFFNCIPAADIITTVVAAATSASVMALLLRTLRKPIEQWLKNRGSREVSLRIGDKQVQIKGHNDIAVAIKALRSLEKPQSRISNRKESTRHRRPRRKP